MTRALTWNTVYAPDLRQVLTPTSRDFVCRERDGFYGRWALHTWDTFFTGLVAAWIDPAYAEGIFGQILDRAGRDGMLPNRVSDDKGRTDDRSQPPVGGYTVLKAYLGSGLSDRTRRRELLTRAYPALRDWHAWWAVARRGPHGLLAWGSDPVDGDPESATIDRAKRESGLDDSPMYDDAVLDLASHTMDLADVGLNALYVADAEALARIAGILGEDGSAAALRRDRDRLARESGEALWDAGRHRYGNRWSTGDFSEHTSPTLLYPLLAGLPDPEQARALAGALLEPGVLGGDPPLPSTARDDPGFSTRYWRGRIWAPMAFLSIEGLRRYDLTGHSRPVVDALLRLFLSEWTEHSHVRENYPIVPGEDVRALAARSDGLMGWGGLLAYLAIQELADPRPDGWRFAHPGRDAAVEHLALAEGRLSVRAADRLTVTLDGRPLLDLPPEAVVSGYERSRDAVRGVVSGPVSPAAGPDRGPLVGVPPGTVAGAPVRVRVADAVWSTRADDRGLVHLDGWVRPDARGRSVAAFSVESR
jgi:glycogen debranching enzyme